MNWVLLLAIAGFLLILGISVLLAILPIKFGDQIPFAKSNYWLASAFCILCALFYTAIVLVKFTELTIGSLLGSMLFCISGMLVGAAAVFFQGPLRDYYAKTAFSLADKLEKQNEAGHNK